MRICLGPDLRATYLDMAPKGRPTLRQHVQAHTECRGNSPLWGADYESWPKPNGNWIDVANSYLDLPQWGPPPWTELQWATLRNVIELAQDAAGLATTGKPTTYIAELVALSA